MLLAGVVLLAAVVGASSMYVLRPKPEIQSPTRVQISGPALFFIENYQAVSPDGRYLAFTGFGSETDAAPQPPMVWLRPLNAANMTPLKQTEGAGHLFWSPDSRYIAYFADGKLKKVAIEGGTPQTICNAPGLARGTWGSNGAILYTEWQTSHAGLFRVSASGGAPTPVKLIGENGAPVLDADWPYFLPDGEHFLFYSGSSIYAGSVRTLTGKRLSSAESRAEYSSGYVLYIRDGNLVAQRFDENRLQLNGDPLPLASGVHHRETTGYAEFTVSPSLLSYLAGGNRKALAVRDRSGAVLREIARADFGAIAVSRDGHRVAAEVWDTANRKPDLWIFDLDRNTGSRFASQQGGVYSPVWSPDGKQLVYSSQIDGKGPPHLYRQGLDGSPPEQLLPAGDQMQRATDWSPQGMEILFTQEQPGCFACAFLGDTWVLSLRDVSKRRLLHASEPTGGAQFSPDEKWIAFVEMQGSEFGIYVVPARGGERQRVSIGSGITPRWRRDGKELFYQAMDSFEYWSVPVIKDGTLHFGKPLSLFARDPLDFAFFDVLPDGNRLVTRVALPGAQEAPLPTVLLNWQAALQ